MSPSSVTIEDVTNEPLGEETGGWGVPHIPPISEFHVVSTSASGGAVSAPVLVPSCTQPVVQPLRQPITSPFLISVAMTWGTSALDGNPLPRQKISVSQRQFSQPLPSQYQQPIFKPQPVIQPIPPLAQTQPPQIQPQQPPY
ncbi:hypothetical protein L2E82_45416 [Cichorium intybus]|uniref:Uncharacterized protein n=1 Tax=Cichorium intybus TaxID=13427 RepID=A0ACB8ZT92_CICIN|nr:hypothetical protein L2E82_45416 [Cichorium intybus]